ncbi:MAG TPA: transposase [Pedobacter sp.]|jgi:REP element-mobilizing transposase RayT
MDSNLFRPKRKSYIEPGKIYFWTATINNWIKLLQHHEYKQVITDSLIVLSDRGKIEVFAFVIMPNHIHLIWHINELNGKETPHGSFLKYTAHQFKKMLALHNCAMLNDFKVAASNKQYEFWQRDSLAIELFSSEVAYQKLDYLHNNPLAEYWQLAIEPSGYLYSSASYYEGGDTPFHFLKDLREEF